MTAIRIERVEGAGEAGLAEPVEAKEERLGVSARSVQELARVGRSLEGRPVLEAALISGRLAWSQVRLLARFVTAEDEVQFIGYAAGTSVRQLERELRAVERGARGRPLRVSAAGPALENGLDVDEEGASTEASEALRLNVPMDLRFKWQRACAYAAQVGGENAPPGTVLEWVTAESLSALPGLVGGDVDHGFLSAWVGWAPGVTVQRLAETVDEALLLRAVDPAGWSALREDPARIGKEVEGDGCARESGRQMCARPTRSEESIPLRVTAPCEVVRLFRRVLCTVRLALERENGRLPSEAEGFELGVRAGRPPLVRYHSGDA